MNSITNHKNHPAEIRRTMQLATPVIIGQVAVFSMNFVDTVMAGRLPEKEIALAALGIGGAVWSSMLMFVLGTLMVVQPSVAQLDGAEMKSEAAFQTRQAFYIALALGIPYWLLCYHSEPLLTGFGIDPVIVPEAAGYLRRMVDDTSNMGMKRIGNLRLARVRIQQQKYDEAIAALEGIDENSSFAGRYHEVRGDAYYAKGDMEAARGEYESALSTVQSESLNRSIVQVKLDSLGVKPGAASAAAETPAPASEAPAEEAPAAAGADEAGEPAPAE